MSHAVAVLATMILMTLLFCEADMQADKAKAKAGYIILDKTAYKLTKAE